MRRGFALLAILCLVVAGSALARPSEPFKATQSLFPGEVLNDQAVPRSAMRADTVWFGGWNQAENKAYNSMDDGYNTAVWTWDAGTTDPLEGWTTIDATQDEKVFFAWVGADSFGAPVHPGDPADANMIFAPVTTNRQIWVGAHEDEAMAAGWSTGMGYGNNWCQKAYSPMYAITAGQAVDITFKYFVDCEIDFDYAYVHILTYDAANELKQTYEVENLCGDFGTAAVPANFSMSVPYTSFTPAPAKVRLQFNFDADGGWSDEDGDYACDYGPFAADDVNFKIGATDNLFNFNSSAGGWTFEKCLGIGAYMNVCTEAQWSQWIQGPPAVRCPCDLSGNALYCATVRSDLPRPGHFTGHEELMASALVDRENFTSANSYYNVVARWDVFNFLRIAAGTFYRPGFYYYPFTTEEDPTPRWSPRSGQDVWHYTGQTPVCQHNVLFSLTAPADGFPLPYNWTLMKLILQVTTDCDAFGIDAATCKKEGITNGAPIYDNVRVGITGGVNAPPIVLETGHLFHDGFGQQLPTFLDPGDVCDANVAYDLSRDGTDYNDWIADTASVSGPPVSSAQYQYWIDLCFRVAKKGPRQDMIPGYSAWKARLTGDPEAGFVCALLDTAMVEEAGAEVPVDNGQVRLTYFHENDPGFDHAFGDRTSEQEVLPDRIFTPGTRVEYYWRSYWAQNPQGYYLYPSAGSYEMEFLPMMEENIFTADEYDVIWPSVLYIDAFNVGSEAYLVPLFDQELGEGNYDKFDRLNFSSNYDAPLMRSFGGTWFNPGSYGNNGCTLEQLLGYRLILFNSGSYGIGSGEIEDFLILENWLTSVDCGLPSIRRGLVMNGDEIASLMADPVEGKAISFCNNTLGVTLTDLAYRDYNADAYRCVWVSPVASNEFTPAAQVSVYDNDCPSIFDYNVVNYTPGIGSKGNLMYEPGTGGGGTYPQVNYAQVVRENLAGPGNVGGWKAVVDGFSWHHLSEVGFLGEECSEDSTAIIAGCADMLGPELAWFIDGGAAPFDKWNYPCVDNAVDEGGDTHMSGKVDFLHASRPNPFRNSATIRFNLASEGPVKIAIYDVSGRLVRMLHDGKASAGETSLVWDGTDNAGNRVSDGIFWVDMVTERGQSTKRAVVLR